MTDERGNPDILSPGTSVVVVLKFNPLGEEEGGNILPGYVVRTEHYGILLADPGGNQVFVPWSNVGQVMGASFMQAEEDGEE